jgi:L-histidine Nalpha-methyltransferase
MAAADASPPRARFFDLLPAATDPAAELRAGLASVPATIAPKYFYDPLGSRLFEAICELPEYTLPRDEAAIFARRTGEIAREVGPGATLIDLGAGNCEKAERLFESLRPAQYVAVDYAQDFLLARLQPLAERHPGIEVIGVTADFTRPLAWPNAVRAGRRLVFYPGSSIGNFSPPEAARFLSDVYALCAGGHLLLGADLVKDAGELVAAYDDALGVTAAFNMNVLNVVNRLAGMDFHATDWRHVALFNAELSRIEMHLEARRATVVHWPGGERRFDTGERIHTENSYKLTLAGVSDLLRAAGFASVRTYTDPADRFALALAR